ncbi:MAG TPA: GNAT family N-acetyltransferase [Thermoleophilaceae bacterium]|nr:GNAT family N-acetyltransferase [Thermoleophilaceae bacterium]
MSALRPHHNDRRAFVERVNDVQRPQGYRLVGAFEGVRVVAVAGFRVIENLVSGRSLYVDDLSTLPESRRRGHAAALVDWCVEEARRLRCDVLELDSAVGPEREDAHRLYFNLRLRITAYHFEKRL